MVELHSSKQLGGDNKQTMYSSGKKSKADEVNNTISSVFNQQTEMRLLRRRKQSRCVFCTFNIHWQYYTDREANFTVTAIYIYWLTDTDRVAVPKIFVSLDFRMSLYDVLKGGGKKILRKIIPYKIFKSMRVTVLLI